MFVHVCSFVCMSCVCMFLCLHVLLFACLVFACSSDVCMFIFMSHFCVCLCLVLYFICYLLLPLYSLSVRLFYREGLYGACFSSSQSVKPKIYATRPSMRVWEAGLNGKVSLTHRLKELLSVPPSPILGHQ